MRRTPRWPQGTGFDRCGIDPNVIDQGNERDRDGNELRHRLEILPGCAHPGTHHGPMDTGLVMRMVRQVLEHMRIHDPLEGQEHADQQERYRDMSNTGHHRVYRKEAAVMGTAF